jgi:hypothetical protein
MGSIAERVWLPRLAEVLLAKESSCLTYMTETSSQGWRGYVYEKGANRFRSDQQFELLYGLEL